MNTEDKLKAICNYSHKDMATPSAQMISYLDFETYDTQKKKQTKRNLLINELLDIEEESNYSDSELNLDSEYDVMALKVMQANVQGNRHTSVDDGMDRLLNDVIAKLVTDTVTPDPMLPKLTLSTDGTKSFLENSQTMARRIITRIMHASNKISAVGRRGPGNAMLLSPKTEFDLQNVDIDQYMTGSPMTRVVDQRIPDGRIIVCRGGGPTDAGLIAMTTQTYSYMHATEKYLLQYAWFEIDLQY
jgi:hypothetical protein